MAEEDMVERVAAAIWSQHTGQSDFAEDTYDHDEKERNWWRDVARIAIEAMREPTAAQIEAAGDCLVVNDDGNDPRDVWQTMIDAALQKRRG